MIFRLRLWLMDRLCDLARAVEPEYRWVHEHRADDDSIRFWREPTR